MSGKQQIGGRKHDDVDAPPRPALNKDGTARKDKASPVGRALRSVYDDTLRESVPDDFLDLLSKLD